MEKSLVGFADRLRDAGIKVSPAELIDASESLSSICIDSRSVLKDALRSTLIKRGRDIPTFDDLFDLYFAGGPLVGSGPDEDQEQVLRELAQLLRDSEEVFESSASPVTQMIMSGRFGGLTRFLLDRLQRLGMDDIPIIFRGNFFQHKLLREIDLDRVGAETEELLSAMQDRGLEPERASAVRNYVRRNLERLVQEGRALVDAEVAKNRYLTVRRIEDEDLANRNLFQLTEDEVLAMRPAVDRLARRLKDRLTLRLRKAELGRFDLKTTLRKNVGFGGPLPDLRFRNKKPARPQVVALCDVSRSVRNFSRFMLLFLYTLKEVIARLRSFIFVGDLAEVTLLFQQCELNEAVSMAADGYGLKYRFGTDYGSTLGQFVDQHLSVVNSRTTVIILGDARTNYLDPRLDALEAIRNRARKIIWLNPEPSTFWSVGDSVMDAYAPYCTTVTECGTLSQLSNAVEDNLIP